MKKFLLIFLIFLISNSTYAMNEVDIYVYGERIPEKAIIKGEGVMLPLRGVAEGLGWKVDYKDGKILITKEGDATLIEFKVGEKEIKVSEEIIKLDTETINFNGKTMVSLDFISYAFNNRAKRDDYSNIIMIENFNPQMADYEYEKTFFQYIKGSLLMPKGFSDEVDIVIKEGDNEGLYIINKKTGKHFYRLISTKDLKKYKNYSILRRDDDGYIIVIPSLIKENKYRKAIKTYSCDINYKNKEALLKFIPEKLKDYPLAKRDFEEVDLYSITKFKEDNSVEIGVYIFLDKKNNLKSFHIKSYDDDFLFERKIETLEARKIAETFAKEALGLKAVNLIERDDLFPNRYEEGVKMFRDEWGGRYAVSLELGMLIRYERN